MARIGDEPSNESGVCGNYLLANEMSITLLLVGQRFKMLLNLKSDNRRGLISEIVDEVLVIHGDGGD